MQNDFSWIRYKNHKFYKSIIQQTHQDFYSHKIKGGINFTPMPSLISYKSFLLKRFLPPVA